MASVALYRLPGCDYFTRVHSESAAIRLNTTEDIGDRQGFVFVPFSSNSRCPILLIVPDSVTTCPLPHYRNPSEGWHSLPSATPPVDYIADFNVFHEAIKEHRFEKLVLAYGIRCKCSTHGDLVERVFFHACALYPELMVILFHTEESGTWLIASPEVLLERDNDLWHTVAIAGTIPYTDAPFWNSKNQDEQHIVSEFITEVITPFAHSIRTVGPKTISAGNLLHLRTDFYFSMPLRRMGALLNALHPTPAVAGIPRAEAVSFILRHEHTDRKYYSGFSGPVNINGETHLYVSLRCAHIPSHNTTATLYAGGGLMPDSCLNEEWSEVCNKAQTINTVLQQCTANTNI